MINYDPRHWWGGVLAWRGTVWPAVISRVLWLAGLTLVWEILAIVVWDNDPNRIPGLNHQAHTWMGVALGLLVVFRTNTAYERFWEGRRLWGGLVNAARNLVRGAAAFASPADELALLVAAYVRAIKHNLRGESDLSGLKTYLPLDLVERVSRAGNPPSILAWHMSTWVRDRADQLGGDMVRVLEGHISTLVDCQGGCERIQKTPIPFVYAVHLRHITLLYLLTLPLVLVPLMNWGAPIAVAVIAFGLLGIEEAGIEIEDPFSYDPNDLPLEEFCDVIARDVQTLAVIKKS